MKSISNLPSNRVALYVNGIENSREFAEKTREMIEEESGVKTDLVYDPYGLSAPFEPDQRIKGEEAVVDRIRDEIVKELDAGKEVTIIAHSYGAYLSLQALREIDPARLKNVIFEGFGGVALVPNDMGLKSAINYRNSWDGIAALGGFLKEKSSYIKTWDEVGSDPRYTTKVLPDGSWNIFNQHAFRINYIKQAIDDLKKWNSPVAMALAEIVSKSGLPTVSRFM